PRTAALRDLQPISMHGVAIARYRPPTHMIGAHEQWLAALLELLEAENELTRRSYELARRRQELPWVRVDKEYRLETDEGSASLADLFRGCSQLLVHHFMSGQYIQLTAASTTAFNVVRSDTLK